MAPHAKKQGRTPHSAADPTAHTPHTPTPQRAHSLSAAGSLLRRRLGRGSLCSGGSLGLCCCGGGLGGGGGGLGVSLLLLLVRGEERRGVLDEAEQQEADEVRRLQGLRVNVRRLVRGRVGLRRLGLGLGPPRQCPATGEG